MMDSILNLLFRCPHRRLTRPVTPVSKSGIAHGQTYVVCLDCGKQFAYDLEEMRVGKAIKTSAGSGVLPPDMPKPRSQKLRYALWASLPVAVFVSSVLRKKPDNPEHRTPQPAAGAGDSRKPGSS